LSRRSSSSISRKMSLTEVLAALIKKAASPYPLGRGDANRAIRDRGTAATGRTALSGRDAGRAARRLDARP
jgi:hypothetical protein